MEEVKALQISVIKYTAALVGLTSLALIVGLQLAAIPFVLGLVLGSSMGVLMFMLLANTVVKATFMTPARAQVYMGLNYVLRYAIMAIVLYISTQMSYLNVFTTAIGILMVKAILYVLQLSDKGKQKQNFKRKEE